MYEELSYLDHDDDDLFPNWNNVEYVKTISDLSRQIRTLLNYRAAIIYQRLCSNDVSYDRRAIVKIQGKKEKFESLALKFIKLLNKLKDYGDGKDGFLKFVYSITLQDKGYYLGLSYERKRNPKKSKINRIYNERTQQLFEIGKRNPFNQQG
jgi:hypothetical protein